MLEESCLSDGALVLSLSNLRGEAVQLVPVLVDRPLVVNAEEHMGKILVLSVEKQSV